LDVTESIVCTQQYHLVFVRYGFPSLSEAWLSKQEILVSLHLSPSNEFSLRKTIQSISSHHKTSRNALKCVVRFYDSQSTPFAGFPVGDVHQEEDRKQDGSRRMNPERDCLALGLTSSMCDADVIKEELMPL
jgi:hypothetical protein